MLLLSAIQPLPFILHYSDKAEGLYKSMPSAWGVNDGKLYQSPWIRNAMTEEDRPCDQIDRNNALEAWRKRMKADCAWLELATDQFQPHSQVSMYAWLRARQDLAQSTSIFESHFSKATNDESTYQHVNATQ